MNISYINKDYKDFKNSLVNLAKTYFPNVYKDFNEANPGGMFLDMSAYIGDILSFYTDTQIQETYLLEANQKENLISMAYSFGYFPKMSYASSTELDIYQLVPSIVVSRNAGGVDTEILEPNMSYCLYIPQYTYVKSSSTDKTFILLNRVDFTETTSENINFVNNDYFLLKQTVSIVSGEVKSQNFTFGNPIKFNSVNINESNIIKILDVFDSEGKEWTEVSYLSQTLVQNKNVNNLENNINFNINDNIPYLLSYKKIPKRFISRFVDENTLKLEFGSGVLNNSDEEVIPNPDNVGLGTFQSISILDTKFDVNNFLKTQEYGLAPNNTTLTVRYLVGGGIESNVPSNDIDTIINNNITFKGVPLDLGNINNTIQQNTILNSLTCNNPLPSVGGRNGDTVEEIRLNSLGAYPSQLRAVTKEDYILRTFSLPSDYGAISKAYITPNDFFGSEQNPFSLDLYVLGYDSNKNLNNAGITLKQNLKQYISQYRSLTDAINIKDAFIVNIGINFEILVNSYYNNNEVIVKCIQDLKEFFNIEKWNINQPIIISDINSILLKVPGVQNVSKIEVLNKSGGSYSPYGYDIKGATFNNIVYPPLNPSIFEVKFLNNDIQGRSINI